MDDNIEVSQCGKGDTPQQHIQGGDDNTGDRITCPKCKGKGTIPVETTPRMFPSRDVHSGNEKKTYKSLALKEKNISTLPSRIRLPQRLNSPVNGLSRTCSSTTLFPSLSHKRSVSNISVDSNTNLANLLPPQVTVDNIKDLVKITKLQFRSATPNDILSALRGVVHIFRQDISCVWQVIPEAYQRISDILKSSTTTELTRLACQVTKMITEAITYISRPTFDEIVVSLLLKTADNKNSIRIDARNALEAIVTHYPCSVVIKVITTKVSTHKHNLVRLSVARSLQTIAEQFGPQYILESSSMREVKKRFLETLCAFLMDNNPDVRQKARELSRLFVGYPEFYEALENNVDSKTLRDVEGIIASLRSDPTEDE